MKERFLGVKDTIDRLHNKIIKSCKAILVKEEKYSAEWAWCGCAGLLCYQRLSPLSMEET